MYRKLYLLVSWVLLLGASVPAQAEPVPVLNHSFELDNNGYQLEAVGDDQYSFDEVLAWSADTNTYRDVNFIDTGVEDKLGSSDGIMHGFAEKGDYFYQVLDQVVSEGDQYTLIIDARDSANGDEICASFFYYDDINEVDVEITSRCTSGLTWDWKTINTLSFIAGVGKPYIGKNLGIKFIVPGYFSGWVAVDNVQVDLTVLDVDLIAANPKPEDKAERLNTNVVLSWSAGTGTTSHNVYFSTDKSAVEDANTMDVTGIYQVSLAAGTTVYNLPEELIPGKIYYWRVDEVSGPNTWKGEVWSFITIDSAVGVTLDDKQGLDEYSSVVISSGGRTLLVPSEYFTIQEAIDDCNDGDTVIVAEGIYTGTGNRDIDFLGKAITVRSTDPNDPNVVAATLIDCGGSLVEPHRGFYFHNNEDANSVVDGLTITNGYANSGGGIYIFQSNPTVINCTFVNNIADTGCGMHNYESDPVVKNCTFSGNTQVSHDSGNNGGGGMYNSGSSPTVTHCTFIDNSVHWRGGGMNNDSSSNPIIINCSFSGNTAVGSGGGMANRGSPVMISCTFSGNTATNWFGGGMYNNFGSNPTITNCSFSGNYAASRDGGGIYTNNSGSNPTVTNCILWQNSDAGGTDESAQIYGSTLMVNYSCIQGWTGAPDPNGTGNIDADPCFVEYGNWADANDPNIIVEPNNPNAVWIDGDYHLISRSPCINTGDPNYVAGPNETDMDGDPRVINGRVDMGAYEYASGALLPDLLVTSEDVNFVPLPGTPNQPTTISATIWNKGLVRAENVEVVFKDYDNIIGDSNIPMLMPGESNTVSIEHTWDSNGFQLITVKVDPYDDISESDETNNSGSKVYQVGVAPDMNAAIEVSCHVPAVFPEGEKRTVSGTAFYRIEIPNEPDFVHPVKGGSVDIHVLDVNQVEQKLLQAFTDTDGQFAVSFIAPGQAGEQFDVEIEVTDETLTGTCEATFYIEEHVDLWIGSEDISFSGTDPNITIEATVHASTDNTVPAVNVPVTFTRYPPQAGSQIGSTQNIPNMPPDSNETASVTWYGAPNGVYCILTELSPGFSDDNNRNNKAVKGLAIGPVPQWLEVDINSPAEGADVNASDMTLVRVSVTDDNGNVIIPYLLETLTLDFNGADDRRIDIKPCSEWLGWSRHIHDWYFDWNALEYVYRWEPPTDANGQACVDVTAESIDIIDSSIVSANSVCVNVTDNAPPTFTIYTSPYWAKLGQSVRITVNSSEPLLGDQLDDIDVNDSNDQPIPFSLTSHDPCSTQWVYHTNSLPPETALGTATVAVQGQDYRSNVGSAYKHFVVEVILDFFVHSQDISFSDDEPNLGDTISIEAVIHANSVNTFQGPNIPVTFRALHTAGDYNIGETQYTDQMAPDGNDTVSVMWTNAAEGWYIIEVELGPDFSDRDASNNQATRAIVVGDECFVTDDFDCDWVHNDFDNCPWTYNPDQNDTDSDGAGNACDDCPTDPGKTAPGLCGCGVPDTDSDSDGTPDCNDNCPFDPNKTEPGLCNCGFPDTDSDSDGTPDCDDDCPFDPNKTEPGLCDCGTPDTDSDGDGTPDCNDPCPFDPNKIGPGICGCGVPDTDSDSDGTPDCNDDCPFDPNNDVDGDDVCGDVDNCPSTANPAQSDIDGDGNGDLCDICPADSNDLCDPNGSDANEIDPNQGGTIETPDGRLRIDIEPNDLNEPTTISVTQIDWPDPNVDLMISSRPGWGQAVAVYDLEPDGLVFNNPVTVTITLDITVNNENECERLGLYARNDANNAFILVEDANCQSYYDPNAKTCAKTCIVELEHFSTIALVVPDVLDWFVDDNAPNDPGPGDPCVSDPNENGSPEHPFDEIQEAIDVAINGDTVIVLDGMYTGTGNRDIDFGGKAITVRSQNGPETCIIDCNGTEAEPHRGFYFHNGEDANSVLDGLTITNGYAELDGGGVFCCDSASPTIINCTFSHNWAGEFGGGMLISICGGGGGGSPTVTGCRFIDNVSDGEGGGIMSYLGSPTITNCIFIGNSADWFGGAIGNEASTVSIVNCTFSRNLSEDGAGIITGSGGSTIVSNCILWDGGDEIEIRSGSSGSVTVNYSDVQGGPSGSGNIDVDPCFADPCNGDYHLLPSSPCIDAADNNAVPVEITTDLDGKPRIIGGIVDMGAYEFAALYVDVNSPNDPGTGTPNDPYRRIQDAIDVAQKGYFVLVAEGQYNESLTIGQPHVGVVGWGSDSFGETTPQADNDFIAIAAGANHSLALKTDGSIVAWGRHHEGQCDVPSPNTGFVAVAAGGWHSLGLKADGSVIAWGRNDEGECNVPSPNTSFVAIAAGAFHSLGLKADGSIVAWGRNDEGQCNAPSPNSGFVAVAGGEFYSLGLKADGSIVAWGSNGSGQCDVPSPNTGFVAVASGGNHSLGLKADGSVVAWGRNDYGECNVPSPNTSFVAIAAGAFHSLGLKADGSIVAWGSEGQCNVPLPNTGFVAVAANYFHSLGIVEKIRWDSTYLFGGYDGNDWNAPRDPNANETIIGGQYGAPVVSIIDASVTIDGFTIQNGDGYQNSYGGGIYCVSNSATTFTVTISNNKIQNNYLYRGYGAGIYCDSYVKPVIVGNIIQNNTISEERFDSAGGGGIYCAGSDCQISRNVVVDNQINSWYGSHIFNRAEGGGIWVGGGLISDNTVLRNSIRAVYHWTQNYVKGGGIYCNGPAVVTQNLVEDNELFTQGAEASAGSISKAYGGGIYAPDSEITLNIVKGNISHSDGCSGPTCPWEPGGGADAMAYGGGIYAPGSSLVNNLIVNNNAIGEGGNGDTGPGGDGIAQGGGIYAPGATAMNNTVADNNAIGTGGSGSLDGASISEAAGIYADSNSMITNTIVWGNSPDQLSGQDCNNVTYCDIGDGNCVASTGNISADPYFVDSNNPDPNLRDYHLLCNSPCIDTGDPNYVTNANDVDIDGDPRVIGGGVDMGADEYSHTQDCDGDGTSDANDNCPLTANPAQSDIDGDGNGDLCDICPADSNDLCDPNGSDANEIDPNTGGTIETPDGRLRIDIEPNDLNEPTTISVTQIDWPDPNVDLMIGPNPGWGQAVAVYILEPNGLQFNSPVTVTVTADVTSLNENQRERLGLYLRDDVNDVFVLLEDANGSVLEDPPGTFTKTCTVELEHFSIYAVAVSLGWDTLAIGDLTSEGIVDIHDLRIMVEDWLESDSIADIYPAPPLGDSIVNFYDFAPLADHWLENAP